MVELVNVCYTRGMYTDWNLPENKEKLVDAVRNNKSVAGVCKELGLKPRGGNYATIKWYIVKWQLPTGHHTGQGWKRDHYTVPRSSSKSATIKRYLVSEHGHECCGCKLSMWQGLPIPLELDHINGIHIDNNIENLRLLCPNCHAQTDTWRGRNIQVSDSAKEKLFVCPVCGGKKGRGSKMCAPCFVESRRKYDKTTNRCVCGKQIKRKSKTCNKCMDRKHKINWPEDDVLLLMVNEMGFRNTGSVLGVSDNAIRKRFKTKGLI